MPVVSPSRFSSASSASLSSGSYRSPLSSSSLDRPYYSSATNSYIPRSSTRSTYTERSSTSVSEYRSHRYGTYDSEVVRERKSSYCSEYGRYGRAPSVSDSDSGVSGVSGASRLASRSDRSSPRSRDASVTRSESARTTRSEPLPRPYLTSSTAELYNKYSPANYVPLAQRLSTAVTGPNGESTRSKNVAGDVSRLPPTRRPLRAQEPERLRSTRPTLDAKGKTASTIIPRARLPSAWNDKKSASSHHSHTNGYRDSSLSISDDNGNDLPLTVSDIRRKFDPKMTVTRLPSRDPDLFYKTALSSDNIYGQVMKHNSSISSLIDEKPVPVHKPITSDKYTNGTTGSLKWEFLSPSPSPVKESKDSSESGYLSKKSTDSSSDVSSVYLSGKLSDDRKSLNSVKNQMNANNGIGKILEKATTIYVGNEESKQTNDESKFERSDSSKNILSIEIGSSKQNKVQNDTDDNLSPKDGTANNLDGSQGNENRSKHTSDFASYIQVSAPTSSPPNTTQKRYLNTLCNGDVNSEVQDTMNESDLQRIKYSEEVPKISACLLSPDENDSSNLRYIDSEPSLETDSKLIIDYNDKDDSVYEEEGFENKTFEHANGHLLRKNEDTDSLRKAKQNGVVKMVDDISDDEDARVVRKAKEGDFNSNDRYSRESSSPVPETPLSKRKYTDLNGETSPASMYQIYQKESSSGKSSSPLNSSSPSSNSVANNVNNSTPCGTLTTSRRRSIDSKSPQPGGETLSKTSGLNGLRNIGNTCFMNSVVQCLSNTKPLLEYCGSPEAFTPDINTTLSCMKGALIKAFSTVITELWKADETDGVVNTTSLKAQIQRFAPRFMGYSQQDAQEFLRYLLEGLHEDVNRVTVKPKPILTEIDDNLSDAQKAQESWQRYLRSEDSRVGDIFVGQLKSSLRCTHCSHTSVTFDPFWDLSLPIPSRTGQHKLTQCLSHFTREEELDGDEKPTCSKCQVRRKCLKWFTVQKFPKVLVLHLKRFSPTERFRGKLNVPVEFPLSGLDMTPYAASTTNNRGPPPPAAIYNLYAVSNHSGTTYSGHYTAYCKHPYNGEWHEYNDSRVSPISQKNVVSSEAYVLFYELASGSSAS